MEENMKKEAEYNPVEDEILHPDEGEGEDEYADDCN